MAFNLIKELKKKNILLAAASSSKNTREILKRIELIDDFNAIVSGYDIEHGKPHPEIFLKAVALLKLDPSECVVFEDSIAGVEAAKAGGFLCVGLDRHNKPENYHKADLCVTDLANVHYDTLNKLWETE